MSDAPVGAGPGERGAAVRLLRELLRPWRRALVLAAGASAAYALAVFTRSVLVKPLAAVALSIWAGERGAGGAPAAPGTDAPTTGAPTTGSGFALLGLAIGGLSLVQAAAAGIRDRHQKRTILEVLLALRLRVAGHLMAVPLARFASTRLGDLLSRLTSDARLAEDAVRMLGVNLWEHGCMIVVGLVAAWILSPTLTYVAVLPIVPLTILLLWILGGRVRRRSAKHLAAVADLTERLQQTLQGMRLVKLFHTEAREEAAYAAASEAQYARAVKVGRARARARGVMELTVNLAMAGVVVVGGVLVVQGRFGLDPPTFIAFTLVLAELYTPLRGFGQVWSAYQESLPAVGRLAAVLAWPPEPAEPADAPAAPPLRTGVRLERVSFTYDGAATPALDQVTLEVPAGTTTALVGESGSGKTTCLDLLLRLHDPTAGRITWDGADLRTLARRGLRARCALVSQDPFLFHATVRENLRYGRPDATPEQVAAALNDADASDVVAGLPEGLDTIVGERGVRLSGGQRQRLTIARALLRDPSLLLLDEATAALDSASEARVVAAIGRLARGRTVVLVAHRLASVVTADQIVVLVGGRIVERGRHAELLAAGGAYARLWQAQGSA